MKTQTIVKRANSQRQDSYVFVAKVVEPDNKDHPQMKMKMVAFKKLRKDPVTFSAARRESFDKNYRWDWEKTR